MKHAMGPILYGFSPHNLGGRTQPQIATMCFKNSLKFFVKESVCKYNETKYNQPATECVIVVYR